MNPRPVELQIEAKMFDLDVAAELRANRLVDITKHILYQGMERPVYAARASVDWAREAAELSQDAAERGVGMFATVSLGELADYMANHKVIDRSQFFHATNWANPEWPQLAMIALCWDTGKEETVAVFGFSEHMKELGLLNLEPEGCVS